jgi:hypothetical protein
VHSSQCGLLTKVMRRAAESRCLRVPAARNTWPGKQSGRQDTSGWLCMKWCDVRASMVGVTRADKSRSGRESHSSCAALIPSAALLRDAMPLTY